MKFYSATSVQVNAFEQSLSVVLMSYKVVLTFEPVNELLQREHSVHAMRAREN